MKGNTMTDFKPGDVALVALREFDACRAIRTPNGWTDSDGVSISDHSPLTVRRLVVIDPESREDAERLIEVMRKRDWTGLDHEAPTDMQAALREFATPTPPRPDEPEGLGAVVEDASQRRWVLTEHGDKYPWFCGDVEGDWRNWESITAARVLSEGVTP